MTAIQPYLTFNGNCYEAMNFYRGCLGGELFIQTVGESPIDAELPIQMQKCVLHSTLTHGNLVIMASDMVSESGLIKGNSISLMLNCATEEEITQLYRQLSVNGKIINPLKDTFFGAIMSDIIDQFGIHWILRFNKN